MCYNNSPVSSNALLSLAYARAHALKHAQQKDVKGVERVLRYE